MKITLIEPRGFCFGVCRALDLLDSVLDKQPIVLHEIVHNKQVVDGYKQKGVRFVECLDGIPESSCVVLSAHGGADSIRTLAQQKYQVIDTTCPFVLKNHLWVKKLEAQGVPIVLIGKKMHPEIQGTLGQLKNLNNVFVVSNVQEIEQLPDMPIIGVAMQTTLGVLDTAEMMNVLKNKYEKILFQNGICQATSERQQAVLNAVKTHRFILVVGDIKSSNANRLVDVAKQAGAKSFLIESITDIEKINFSDSVAIMAAASAPESLVQEIYHYLMKKYN